MLTLICQIIHPKIKIEPSNYFPDSQNFWDNLVKVGSSHLILPSIYQGIIKKKLVDYVPNDLMDFLSNIYTINYERNNAIINQINFIVKIFNKNKIDYVLLKGAAILFSEIKNHKMERMVGDIDILVKKKDVHRAQNILLENGYYVNSNNEINYIENRINYHRHLDKLIHNNYIASVEIHHRLLVKNKDYLLKPSTFFKSKRCVNDFIIPSKFNMWLHAILNWQYNDNGFRYNFLNLRAALDVFYLENFSRNKDYKNLNQVINKFYSLISVLIPDYNKKNNISKFMFKLQLKFKLIYKLNSFCVKFSDLITISFSRLKLIIMSEKYRKTFFNNISLIGLKVLRFWNR